MINKNMNCSYYVYQYVNPFTQKPFYIGKGKGDRLYKHLKETVDNTDNTRKFNYIQKILSQGFQPIIEKIAINLFEDAAYDLEAALIAKYGRLGLDKNGILMNLCLDNRPPKLFGPNHPNYGKPNKFKHTEEAKQKISAKAKGRRSWHKGKRKNEVTKANMKGHSGVYTKSDKHKAKLRIANLGENNPNFGTIWITNGISNTKVMKESILIDGWYKGRTMKRYKSHVWA